MFDLHEIFVTAFMVFIFGGGIVFILAAHMFLNRLIKEGKIEGPSTGEVQSHMLGWLMDGKYPPELNDRDRKTADILALMLRLIFGSLLLIFVLALFAEFMKEMS